MIYVTGQNHLSAAVFAAVKDTVTDQDVAQVTSLTDAEPKSLLVAVADNCQISALRPWIDIGKRYEMPLLCVHLHGGEAVIGPEIRPGIPGCMTCWMTRYYNGRRYSRQFSEIGASAIRPVADPWLDPLTASIIAQLVAVRIWSMSCDTADRGTGSQPVYYWDMERFTGKAWPLLVDPLCASCGQVPFDDPEKARLQLSSRMKAETDSDRLLRLEDLDFVSDLFVGKTGLVSGVSTAWRFWLGAVAITDLWFRDNGPAEPCSGFADSCREARLVALLEAVERYSSARPRGRRVAVHGSVASLGNTAVDPESFGLYSPQQYAANADRLIPYTRELELDFVWAFSFAKQEPVLLPTEMAFYTPMRSRNFVIEGSNGCALGSCPEEAILHAIYEVIERDALLLAWYRGRKLRALNVWQTQDVEILSRCRLLQAAGFEVIALDATTDFGIPAVFAAAFRHDNALPFFICAGAAHLRPERALRKALRELSAHVNRYMIEFTQPETLRRANTLSEDPLLARSIDDHPLCYANPRAKRAIDFLLNPCGQTSLEEMGMPVRAMWGPDLGMELKEILIKLLRTAVDVTAVDQTAPEQGAAGLHTYKVLITGAIPVSWGSGLYRHEGLPRLAGAPCCEAARSSAHPVPLPHPFI